MYPTAEKRFIRANRVTIIFLFLVIIAGGVVRSTGSGMGCPDWPKCFNRIVPPTDISQLPEDYEQHYVEGRVKKNLRFAKMVETFGFKEEADKIRHDESILEHEEFNAVKTWTEYINRLVGVIVGFCLLFTAFFSFTYRKSKPSITVWSVLNVFLVVLQAWMGSIVVSTNLMPWIITVHMVLALVIVAVSIYTYFLATTLRNKDILFNHRFKGLKAIAAGSFLILFVQIVFGTGVREEIDSLNAQGIDRESWIGMLGQQYEIHWILGYVTLGVTVLLFFLVRNCFNKNSLQSKFALIIVILAVSQMLSGITLARFGVPAVAQTTHLVLASLFFGAQYYLMLIMTRAKL